MEPCRRLASLEYSLGGEVQVGGRLPARVESCEVSNLGHHGDDHSVLRPTQSLQGAHDWVQSPAPATCSSSSASDGARAARTVRPRCARTPETRSAGTASSRPEGRSRVRGPVFFRGCHHGHRLRMMTSPSPALVWGPLPKSAVPWKSPAAMALVLPATTA